jgi:hypothetical protein
MIDKNTFIDTINLLEVAIKSEDNDEKSVFLIKKIFTLLSLFFAKNPEAISDIEDYCYLMNFGKPSPDSEYVTPGELYESLLETIR